MAHNLSVMFVADNGQALVKLCGISLLERSLRILQRLGFQRVTILSDCPALIQQHLAKPSWARSQIEVAILPRMQGMLSASDDMVLVLRGDVHHEARLFAALSAQQEPALLVDSDPPAPLLPLLDLNSRTPIGFVCGAALVGRRRLAGHETAAALFASLSVAAQAGEIGIVDVREQQTYLVNLRRHLRPLWFPGPNAQQRQLAEGLLLDAAQNGTLDFPAKLHAPIETWIIRRLCKTRITPTQITLCTAVVSAVTTVLFARGHLVAGTSLALVVGVLDGLDGKQARVKVETTQLGKREHALDYVLELSWWGALAYYFQMSGQLPQAYVLWALLVLCDLLDRSAKRIAKQHTGRNLDDISPIDRFVRLIGGRRNIYVWLLALGLALGQADQAFVGLCSWGALTAAVHWLRAFWITRTERLAE